MSVGGTKWKTWVVDKTEENRGHRALGKAGPGTNGGGALTGRQFCRTNNEFGFGCGKPQMEPST